MCSLYLAREAQRRKRAKTVPAKTDVDAAKRAVHLVGVVEAISPIITKVRSSRAVIINLIVTNSLP
jgi:hypothetical protein